MPASVNWMAFCLMKQCSMDSARKCVILLLAILGVRMTHMDTRPIDLDAILRGDDQTSSDCDTARHRVLTQTGAASGLEHGLESPAALQQRLQEKEAQVRTLQRELRLREQRIAQLERLSAQDQDEEREIQNAQIVAMGLVLQSVNKPGVKHRICRITTTIGRGGYSDIVLDSSSVSRSHARVVVASNSIFLIDLQSCNGCAVNGERISRRAINSGDIITFGDVQFRFVAGVPNSHSEERWMDDTQVLLDESIVFTRASPSTATELRLVSEDMEKAK